ncbi:MAG TPA: CDP-glucose 4,6-dehydratase [Gammaproteobacteria bacterium]|nr:CDP-glucose 4,6-dehydratase [Gammaproteobacteria bacterium]
MAQWPRTLEGMALNELFGGAYTGRKVLVTGHTGFKGSWLCLWLTTLGAKVTGFALPPDTDPSHWNLLGLRKVHDLHGDLRNGEVVRQTLEQIQPEIVFHLAAQPLVRRSYREPVLTFDTNILGLVHLLEAVRNVHSVRALVNVTTDKVYIEQSSEAGYREDQPLGGYDPYSTSKACAELLTECYRKSFLGDVGTRMATARAGNVIGGGDWSEDRLVPDLVRAASRGEVAQIRNPDAVRPWQHVLEPLSGYLRLGQKLLANHEFEGPWNFGPTTDATMSVQELVARMQAHWPILRSTYHQGPHPHEAMTLRLDCSKSSQKLAWWPVWKADETLQRTAHWYRDYYETGRLRSNEDLQDYVGTAHAAGLEWTA